MSESPSAPPGGEQPGQPPQYGQPTYGQPGFGAPGYGPPGKTGTNGFAIAALVFGIIGGILLAVIFGFIALSQIKKTGQAGRGLAIAGLVLAALYTIGVIIIIAVAANNNTPSYTSLGSLLR